MKIKVYKSEKSHVVVSAYRYNNKYIIKVEQRDINIRLECKTKELANEQFKITKQRYKDLVLVK